MNREQLQLAQGSRRRHAYRKSVISLLALAALVGCSSPTTGVAVGRGGGGGAAVVRRSDRRRTILFGALTTGLRTRDRHGRGRSTVTWTWTARERSRTASGRKGRPISRAAPFRPRWHDYSFTFTTAGTYQYDCAVHVRDERQDRRPVASVSGPGFRTDSGPQFFEMEEPWAS